MMKLDIMREKERIVFFDAIKAFMIFCVVYWHIAIYTGTTDSPLNRIYMPFFLTSFFFVSGYFSYNEGTMTFYNCVKKIIKRCKTILIPSMVMCTLYSLYSGKIALQVLFDEMKGGYWFTFVTFEIYLFYLLVEFCCKFNGWHKLLFYILLISFFSGMTAIGHKWDSLETYRLLSIYQVIKYIPFFYLGIISKLHQNLFFRLLKNDFLLGISLVLMTLLYLNNNRINMCLQGYLGIYLICALFYKFKNLFEQTNSITHFILMIGQNTLPIYFLHYFFLKGIVVFSFPFQFIMNNGGWVLNGILTSVIVLIIISLCIFFKKIIGISPTLQLILLGSKDSRI